MSNISEEREKRQAKVFKKWVNSHLKRAEREVTDLEKDFDDGVNLCIMYELLSGEKLRKYRMKPRSQIEKCNNLAVVLAPVNKFVKEVGIGLQYSPQQIEKGDRRQVLGMLWILITKFVIPESEEDISRKKALLKWVQKVTAPYDNVNVKNFTRSWCDGLAFNALLHQFDNDLIDYDKLTKDDPTHNCNNAFTVAEKELDITALLDAEDVVDVIPDEKSVMMYVSLYYQAFHKGLEKKLKREADQYLIDVAKLIKWIEDNVENYRDTDFTQSLEEARKMEDVDLPKFLKKKNQMANYKCHLYVKLAGIQFRQKKERLKVFIPDDDHALSKVHSKWMDLNNTIVKYSTALRDYIIKLEEEIRDREEQEEREKEEQELAEQEKKRKEIEDELARIQAELEQRKKEQDEIMRKIEEERQQREKERQQRRKEYEDRRALDNEERQKLSEFDKKASDVVTWLYTTQNEMSQVESKESEEKDIPDEESTDEETKNKRKEAVEECGRRVAPIMNEWENLGDFKEGASISGDEIKYAKSTFGYFLEGEEDDDLKTIRGFKLEEDDE